MSRRLLFGCAALTVLALLAAGPARAADEADVSGRYEVHGINLSGGEYRGAATVKKVGDIYRVTWVIANEEHRGVGLVQGDAFCVAWGVAGGGDAGIVAYKIGANGKLSGKWIGDYEKGAVLVETLTPLK